jgi:glyoxylate reductase
MKPKVLITVESAAENLSALDGIADVEQWAAGGSMMPRDEVMKRISGLTAILAQGELKIDSELMDAGPHLRIVANGSVGFDNFDLDLMTERGVWATNAPDSYTDATADMTFALLLAYARSVPSLDRKVRDGKWTEVLVGPMDGMLLSGKTHGIVGFGKIGRAVAKRSEAFGMNVLFYDPVFQIEDRFRPLDELLPAADIVSVHVPLTPETHHLFDETRFMQMKKGAVLINVSRGPVVHEAALISALESGHLGGAGIDVFENEPNVPPALRKLDNVVLSPHLGGCTRESRNHSRELAAANIAAVLRDERPSAPLNEVSS